MGIRWADYFYYDESSPSCLRWKVDRRSGKNFNIVCAKAGDVAGSMCIDRWEVGFKGRSYRVHRIVWELHNSPLGHAMIDHINGDSTDNRILNLRAADIKVNSRNTKKSVRNTSGKVGVVIHKSKHDGKTYCLATWKSLDGRWCRKTFSVHKYGIIPAFAMACAYRELKIKELNEYGAGYTERHGT